MNIEQDGIFIRWFRITLRKKKAPSRTLANSVRATIRLPLGKSTGGSNAVGLASQSSRLLKRATPPLGTPEVPPNSRPQRPTLRPKPRTTGGKIVLTATVQGKQLLRGGTQEAKSLGLSRFHATC